MTDFPVTLITDSTCDIPDDLLEEHQIRIAPQYLIWGTEEYRDRFDISAEEFYRRLPEEAALPSSSQPVERDFSRLLDEAIQAGAESALIITISNKLSGTVESARQAAEKASIPVKVIDSLSGGMGLGWQVLAAARAREGGLEAMAEAANRARETLKFVFFVDSLDALHRGGRIGGASRFVGTMLNLKPMLYIDHIVGQVEADEKVRTRSRALGRIFERFSEQIDASRPLHVAVVHSNAAEYAEKVAERITQALKPIELFVTTISPVMGTHIGPGAVGIAGYTE